MSFTVVAVSHSASIILPSNRKNVNTFFRFFLKNFKDHRIRAQNKEENRKVTEKKRFFTVFQKKTLDRYSRNQYNNLCDYL